MKVLRAAAASSGRGSRALIALGIDVRLMELRDDRSIATAVLGASAATLDWRVGDVRRADDVRAAMRDCDHVIHLAGLLTPACQSDPLLGAAGTKERLTLASLGGPAFLLLLFSYLTQGALFWGITLWIPLAVKTLGFTGFEQAFASAIPYLFAVVLAIPLSRLSDRTKRRTLIAGLGLLIPGLLVVTLPFVGGAMAYIASGQIEHRAAATLAVAVARVIVARLAGFFGRYFERVIDKQLLAWRNVADRVNVDATVFFGGFTVCHARVIEPPRAIPAAATVDHASIGQAEQERVSVLLAFRVVASRFPPRGHQTFVLEDALAGGNRPKRKNALSMNRRLPYGDTLHTGPREEERGSEYSRRISHWAAFESCPYGVTPRASATWACQVVWRFRKPSTTVAK